MIRIFLNTIHERFFVNRVTRRETRVLLTLTSLTLAGCAAFGTINSDLELSHKEPYDVQLSRPKFEGRDLWGRTTLHRAALSGNIDYIKRFNKSENSFLEIDFSGRSPIHMAVLGGMSEEDLQIVLDLAGRDSACSVDRHGLTPLDLAAAFSQSNIIDLLHELPFPASEAEIRRGNHLKYSDFVAARQFIRDTKFGINLSFARQNINTTKSFFIHVSPDSEFDIDFDVARDSVRSEGIEFSSLGRERLSPLLSIGVYSQMSIGEVGQGLRYRLFDSGLVVIRERATKEFYVGMIPTPFIRGEIIRLIEDSGIYEIPVVSSGRSGLVARTRVSVRSVNQHKWLEYDTHHLPTKVSLDFDAFKYNDLSPEKLTWRMILIGIQTYTPNILFPLKKLPAEIQNRILELNLN